MNDISSRPIPADTTLERALPRGLDLLAAIARYPEIAATLGARGYTREEHALGWALIAQAGGKDLVVLEGGVTPNAVREAITTLDHWDEPNFRLASKALLRRHPAQHAFVFQDLKPATGLGAVIAVQTFLERLTALESSPDRETTRPADLAALATLAARGIDANERTRLGELVTQAKSIPAVASATAEEASAARAEQLKAALVELHYWWDDWAEVARQSITKRIYLRALGLVTASSSPSHPTPPSPTEPESPGPTVDVP